MRLAIVLLIAGIASVSANADFNKRQNVPQCALTCVTEGPAGSCSQSDVACLCANSNFVNSVSRCITSTCNASDVSAAASFASQTCAQAGVTLSNTGVPSATGSESASAPSPSSTGPTPSTTPSSAAGQNGVSAFSAFVAALGLSFFAL